jgi:hypothetical protein
MREFNPVREMRLFLEHEEERYAVTTEGKQFKRKLVAMEEAMERFSKFAPEVLERMFKEELRRDV